MRDDDENNIDQINKMLKDLSALLKLAIGQPDRTTIWLSILGNVEEIIDGYQVLKRNRDELADYWLVSVAVGLNMYFSYYDMTWMENSDTINVKISEIVTSSARYLNSLLSGNSIITQLCGQHEDGACLISKMTKRYDPLAKAIKSRIPDGDLTNFLEFPEKDKFDGKERLFRVIGRNNLIKGNWWFRGEFPQNKTQWRSRYAVLSDWNKDNYYVEFTPNENIVFWRGIAASQKVYWRLKLGNSLIKFYPNTRCILPGGREQIWLNVQDVPNDLTPQKTGW